jgi:hypothetical protein
MAQAPTDSEIQLSYQSIERFFDKVLQRARECNPNNIVPVTDLVNRLRGPHPSIAFETFVMEVGKLINMGCDSSNVAKLKIYYDQYLFYSRRLTLSRQQEQLRFNPPRPQPQPLPQQFVFIPPPRALLSPQFIGPRMPTQPPQQQQQQLHRQHALQQELQRMQALDRLQSKPRLSHPPAPQTQLLKQGVFDRRQYSPTESQHVTIPRPVATRAIPPREELTLEEKIGMLLKKNGVKVDSAETTKFIAEATQRFYLDVIKKLADTSSVKYSNQYTPSRGDVLASQPALQFQKLQSFDEMVAKQAMDTKLEEIQKLVRAGKNLSHHQRKLLTAHENSGMTNSIAQTNAIMLQLHSDSSKSRKRKHSLDDVERPPPAPQFREQRRFIRVEDVYTFTHTCNQRVPFNRELVELLNDRLVNKLNKI